MRFERIARNWLQSLTHQKGSEECKSANGVVTFFDGVKAGFLKQLKKG